MAPSITRNVWKVVPNYIVDAILSLLQCDHNSLPKLHGALARLTPSRSGETLSRRARCSSSLSFVSLSLSLSIPDPRPTQTGNVERVLREIPPDAVRECDGDADGDGAIYLTQKRGRGRERDSEGNKRSSRASEVWLTD